MNTLDSCLVPDLDWKNPNYTKIFQDRIVRLERLRSGKFSLEKLKAFYKENEAQFIIDWGCTTDPRNVAYGLPATLPFILFPRQIEWIKWALTSWKEGRPGVTPKSRESGISWLGIALSCTLCLFNQGMTIGWGSRLEEYVDKIGEPKSLFWKARKFIELLPTEFKNNFDLQRDAPHMRLIFRQTDSIISGEGGDNIGRGARTSIYFVDEAAYLMHPELVDAALSQTTRCRIDVSTPNGLGNPFHRKVTEWSADRVFQFHWRDDPRKDEEWYERQKIDLDPVTLAQEVDIDFAASLENVLIPQAWVQAAIDAHIKLKITPTGAKEGALDVADEGRDLNAFCGAHGILIECLEEWSGKGSDIFRSVQRAFELCDQHGYSLLRYDADGVGAGSAGAARVLNENRLKRIEARIFRGSAGVIDPENEDVPGRTNADMFLNCKAQSWWGLRNRFQTTYRAIKEQAEYRPDDLISIPGNLPFRQKLCMELSQPTYGKTSTGKIIVEKMPDGTRSPNLADAVVIRFARIEHPFVLNSDAVRDYIRLIRRSR